MRLINSLAIAAVALSGCSQRDTMPYQNSIAISPEMSRSELAEAAAHVVPTPNQLTALDDGFIGFFHFGPNTFTSREWGTGFEDPKIFNPTNLDTDQWVKAMKDAGMKKVILTAKHHDGFVLWNSRYTDHGVMSSPWRDGKGDIMRDLSESCKKYGMKLGIYLSPADLYQIENPDGLYGNLSPKTQRVIPRQVEGRPFESDVTFTFEGIDDYNEYFLNQLYELLTEYGPIDEVWLDGAHPKRKGGQTYNYPAWRTLVRALAPNAVIFGREDLRWVGNEGGQTRYAERNVVGYEFNPDTVTVFPDLLDQDLGSLDVLSQANFLHYQPTEIDTSIRDGWFYRNEEEQKTRSAEDVFDIYERGVGGNGVVLLNVPPNRDGLLPERDVKVLAETGRRIRETYGTNLLEGAKVASEIADKDINTYIKATKPVEIKLPEAVTINRLMVQEPVGVRGERIDSIALDAWVDGGWKEIATAPNVGFKRILQFSDVNTDKLRLRVEGARLEPYIAEVSGHYYKAHAPRLDVSRKEDGKVHIRHTNDGFGWHRGYSFIPLPAGTEIHYTTDGTDATPESPIYTEPIEVENCVVKAIAILNGETGPMAERQLGYNKTKWEIEAQPGNQTIMHADKNVEINGIIYSPHRGKHESAISKGKIEVSDDGKTWRNAGAWEFSNMTNNPSPREYRLATPAKGQYIKITIKEPAEKPLQEVADIDVF